MKLRRKGKIFLRYLLGPLLLLLLSGALVLEIRSQQDLPILLDELNNILSKSASGQGLLWLILLLLLMPVNWLLEAYKWKMAIATLQPVKLITAFKATLSGVSFSVSLPNRVGEYLGRMLYLEEENRLKAIPVTVIASLSQLILTFIAGALSMIYLFPAVSKTGLLSNSYCWLFLGFVLIGLVFLLLLYFKIGGLASQLLKIFEAKWFRYWVEGLRCFDRTRLVRMLGLSTLRFGIFLLQYGCAFALFNVSLTPINLMATVSLSFLLMSVVPNFAVAELGIRGIVMVWVIGMYSTNKAGILLATLSIWLVNLILPAAVGALLLIGNRKLYAGSHEKN